MTCLKSILKNSLLCGCSILLLATIPPSRAGDPAKPTVSPTESTAEHPKRKDNDGGSRNNDKRSGSGNGQRSSSEQNHDPDCGNTISFIVDGKTLWNEAPDEASKRLGFARLDNSDSRWKDKSGLKIHDLLQAYPEAARVFIKGCGSRWQEFDGPQFREKARPVYLIDNRGKKIKLIKIQGRSDTQLLKIVSQVEIISGK